MLLRTVRFPTLLLAALALTMTSALYRYFAIVGGMYAVGALRGAAALAVLVRHRRGALRWTLPVPWAQLWLS